MNYLIIEVLLPGFTSSTIVQAGALLTWDIRYSPQVAPLFPNSLGEELLSRYHFKRSTLKRLNSDEHSETPRRQTHNHGAR